MFDLQDQFELYDILLFQSKLKTHTDVSWYSSHKRYGVCEYIDDRCYIKLSKYLLRYSAYEDIRDTLIHEMVHAYMFIEDIEDDDDHGTIFEWFLRDIEEKLKL